MFTNPWIYAVLVAVFAASLFGAYSYGRIKADADCVTKVQAEAEKQRKDADAFWASRYNDLDHRYQASMKAAAQLVTQVQNAQDQIDKLTAQAKLEISHVADAPACRIPVAVVHSLNGVLGGSGGPVAAGPVRRAGPDRVRHTGRPG